MIELLANVYTQSGGNGWLFVEFVGLGLGAAVVIAATRRIRRRARLAHRDADDPGREIRPGLGTPVRPSEGAGHLGGDS